MAITVVKEQPWDREVEFELFGKEPENVRKSYVRRFYIAVDDLNDDQRSIELDPAFVDIPEMLSIYKNFDGSVTDDKSVLTRRPMKQVEDNPYLWVVHCYYAPDYSLKDEPADISIGFRQTMKPFSQAVEDDYLSDNFNQRVIDIVNTANDPFDPPLEAEVGESVIKITRYEDYSTTVEDKIRDYQDSLNKLSFRSKDALTCKINIGAERVLHNGTYYYKVTYEISHKKDGWRSKIMNRGYREINGDGVKVNIIDRLTQARASQPQPLNGDGAKIDGLPNYLTFCLYYIKDWTDLNLDAAF